MALTITVEDGTGVAGANSYISLEDARDYADSHPGLSLPASDAEANKCLIAAMDYIEALAPDFSGSKLTKSQPLQWPRTGAQLDRFDIDDDEIPSILPQAQARLACDVAAGTDLQPISDGREVILERVEGATTTQYAPSGSINPQPQLTAARALLNRLLSGGSSGGCLDNIRA